MDEVILRTMARALIPFLQLFGVYVVLQGHISPGGAFAGGAIVASSFVLGTLVLGPSKNAGKHWGRTGHFLESIGGIWCLLLGFLGLLFGTGFLSNARAGFPMGEPGRLLSSGFIPLVGAGLGIKVTATLVALFRGLAGGSDDA